MLEKIQKPNDIKNIPAEDLPALAEEIRSFIIESLSKTGGHLASNLGVVELERGGQSLSEPVASVLSPDEERVVEYAAVHSDGSIDLILCQR